MACRVDKVFLSLCLFCLFLLPKPVKCVCVCLVCLCMRSLCGTETCACVSVTDRAMESTYREKPLRPFYTHSTSPSTGLCPHRLASSPLVSLPFPHSMFVSDVHTPACLKLVTHPRLSAVLEGYSTPTLTQIHILLIAPM